MNRFEPTTEDITKPEVQESYEALKTVENPEQLRSQMLSEAEKETTHFKKECFGDLAQVEARAKKDGLAIDVEDKKALQGLNEEAESAKTELNNELAEKNENESRVKIARAGMEKIHNLFSAGKQFDEEYAALSRLLMKQENGQSTWKSLEEIDISAVEEILNMDKQEEALEKGKEKIMSLHVQEKNTSPEYLALYANLTKSVNGQIVWKDASEIDFKKVEGGLVALSDDQEMPPNIPGEKSFDENLENPNKKESEKSQAGFEEIDTNLFKIAMGEDGFKKYIEQQKNLPPDAIVHLYHGLNSGGYKSALEIVNSPLHGIEQRSGPTVSLVPVGQFWKGVGFRYALRRDQIEFPGENNPNAVIRMMSEDGMEDTGYIVNESQSLPFDQYEVQVMRSKFSDPDPEAEKELTERLRYFAEIRNANKKVKAENLNELVIKTESGVEEEKETHKVISSGQAKLHDMVKRGRINDSDYQKLSEALFQYVGGQAFWKSEKEIDLDTVRELLQVINEKELQRKEQAEKTIERFGSSLEVFDKESSAVETHLEHLGLLPAEFVKFMITKGLMVKLSDTDVVSMTNSEALRNEAPRGSKVKNWEGVPGCYCRDKKTVCAGNGKLGHACASLMLHEYGHGFGELLNIINSRETIEAHKRFFHKLGSYFQQGGPGGAAGIDEMVSESFGEIMMLSKNEFINKYDDVWYDYLKANIYQENKI